MNLKNQIAEIVKNAVATAVDDGAIPPEIRGVDVKIEYPRDQKFGDYATPFALESARVMKRSPMEIGSILAPYMGGDSRIDTVEVVKPGFINMFISRKFLFDTMKEIIRQGQDFGKVKKEEPKRINIEFVSANPTGPLNIVNARAAAVGDTIANLLEFTGDIVDREFYVNDHGNQVDLLGLSVRERMRELRGEQSEFPEDGYHGEYVRDIARHILEECGDETEGIEDGAGLVEYLASKAVEYNVDGQRRDLEAFNVRFANWFREKTLHDAGRVGGTLDALRSRGVVYSDEGKEFFRSTGFGDDKDRVLVRDDGRPTYFLADIAYHHDKIMRGYDHLIDIWGPDHHGHITRMEGAMDALGFGKILTILVAQQVNLLLEGETVKMSKRLGQFSTMRDLIEEIGVDVARYFFVMRSLESHLDFDLALAKKESSENPVFYLQYAHARICSLFREGNTRNVPYDPASAIESHLCHEASVLLMKHLARFPEEILDAAEKCEPHRVTSYLMKVAQAFHRFYSEHRILTDDIERTVTYLALSDAVRIVMANGLGILGVTAPERM